MASENTSRGLRRIPDAWAEKSRGVAPVSRTVIGEGNMGLPGWIIGHGWPRKMAFAAVVSGQPRGWLLTTITLRDKYADCSARHATKELACWEIAWKARGGRWSISIAQRRARV